MTGPGVAPSPEEVAAVEAGHRARVRDADPVAVVPDLLGPGAGTGGLLVARLADGSCAVGEASSTDVSATSPLAASRALREHRLRARASGPDVAGALRALLGTWSAQVATQGTGAGGPTGEPDEALSVTWPSRDVEAVPALLAAGLRPTVHLALRRGAPGGTVPRVAPEVVVRDATAADVEAIVEHQVAELAYDALVGAARSRPAARKAVAPQVAAAVARPGSVVLVAAGPDGQVQGVVAVEPPDRSGWVAGTVTTTPVAYLVLLHVRRTARGAGTGGALLDAALARLHAAHGPATAVLLHHGVLNPLSAPFWARHGFRPVLTTWEADRDDDREADPATTRERRVSTTT
ncbi:GNAT family N-acetyltransferase [Cellulosimicrobium marinum]|uniref:GNAT family N-acetyltransferase n=1 Tax=Cellulosimicrobium marinum TaxID=1638992 RepID=UPI001E35645E|nr:GNAT family N-acetyltransferase [Cellulosimicrobium marinum]MCB7136713.1 GNAT family N-acetyltransferase [Cellulosimicrobium marinum]